MPSRGCPAPLLVLALLLFVLVVSLCLQLPLLRTSTASSFLALTFTHDLLQKQRRGATFQCDIFNNGRWVRDAAASYPLYNPTDCPFVEDSFSCEKNGRPDSDYMRWRWQSSPGCTAPRFNSTDLLQRLIGKRLVFVGDSLSRNQWESMLCLLREALPNKNRVLEESNPKQTNKEKGVFVVHFLDYNCKVEFYSSRFLVAEHYNHLPELPARSFTLRLDMVHESHKMWKNASILVFTTGHWWTHGKTAKGRDFYQEGQILHHKLNLMVAFRKAMRTWAEWVDKSLNPDETSVFISGYSPGHFRHEWVWLCVCGGLDLSLCRGGKWNTGGKCQNETLPIMDGSELPNYSEKMAVLEQTVHLMKFPTKLLNVTWLSSFRKDGHPSVYHGPQVMNPDHNVGYEDCSHWCLPGVPDTWNELLYAML